MREPSGPSREARTQATRPVGQVLEGLIRTWGIEPHYRLWLLRTHWREVATEAWMATVRPVRVDGEGRLVVSTAASTVSQEIRYRNQRWRALLDRCREAADYEFTDLVLESTGRRTKRRSTEKGQT